MQTRLNVLKIRSFLLELRGGTVLARSYIISIRSKISIHSLISI